MRLLLLLPIIGILRYFVPFVTVTQEEFDAQCGEHEVYYELSIDSLGNETEEIKRTSDDKVLQTYIYKACYKPDSTWFIPIKNRVDSLENEILATKDKETKKRLQDNVDWLKKRYYKE